MSTIKPVVQPAAKRIKSFSEVSIGLTKKSMVDEAIRYPMCQETPCDHGCPLGVDIPGFIRLIREGDSAGALSKIREANDLPAICGRVCPAPCEHSCILEKQQLHVGIRALERFASDHGRPRFVSKRTMTRTGKKVAVIGSGPAGLTAAAQLAKAGFKVTVHEMMPLLGGSLRYGIPEFRLPKNVLDAEIEEIRNLGVEFKTNFAIGQTIRFEQFMSEGYSAVLLTTGKNSVELLDLPGADLGGVYYAKEILLHTNSRFEDQLKKNSASLIGSRVAVIGNTNAAVDCCRIFLRLGREVTLIFSETVEDLKVYSEDIEHAKEEGLKLEPLTKALSILPNPSAPNYSAGVQCVRMDFAHTESDTEAGGKWELKPVPASEFVVNAETIILAGTFKVNISPLFLTTHLKVNDNGQVWIDPQTYQTAIAHLYAAGDAVGLTSTLIEAMASGKKAAQAIIQSIRS